ncbi:MAG: Spy/CpxP family protein refolding chaperone [Thermodesulfobacteriota bacterium]
MKKTAVIVLSLVLAAALMTSAAFAGPWGGRFYGMGPGIANLTPEQSAKILALQQANLEKVNPIQQELFAKKTELRSLWLNPNPDQAKINALQQEIFNLVDQLQQESIKLRADILKVINP